MAPRIIGIRVKYATTFPNDARLCSDPANRPGRGSVSTFRIAAGGAIATAKVTNASVSTRPARRTRSFGREFFLTRYLRFRLVYRNTMVVGVRARSYSNRSVFARRLRGERNGDITRGVGKGEQNRRRIYAREFAIVVSVPE